jgi:hypothetical protein
MKIRLTLLLMIASVPALAQEPRTPIKPAEPIAAATHEVTIDSNDGTMPIIYPSPLPPMKLGMIARAYRAAHAAAPKATKVANDEQPIVVEPKQEEKQ